MIGTKLSDFIKSVRSNQHVASMTDGWYKMERLLGELCISWAEQEPWVARVVTLRHKETLGLFVIPKEPKVINLTQRRAVASLGLVASAAFKICAEARLAFEKPENSVDQYVSTNIVMKN